MNLTPLFRGQVHTLSGGGQGNPPAASRVCRGVTLTLMEVAPVASPTEAARPDFRAFFDEQQTPLVRLAYLLLGDTETARDVAQDVMTELYRRWDRFGTYGHALGYARTSVVNRSRNVLRHDRVVRAADPVLRHEARAAAVVAPTGQALDRQVLLAHVRELPRRQREVVVLRYWLDLSEADIADTLGISRGTVKSTASKALAALAHRMGDVR